ncbi:MAG: PQQ-binding-like beta-propeller repeat protein [Pyrinomonadaceae bacterium]
MQHSRFPPLVKALCLGCLLVAFPSAISAQAQPDSAAPAQRSSVAEQNPVPFTLRWQPKPRVKRYRLQVARDAKFDDIVFDRAVIGLEQEVTGLQSGKYYWRVAPATKETGRYSAPLLVEATIPVPRVAPVSAKTAAAAAVMRPPADTGWQAAVGAVARPFAARLRAGKSFDLIAMNADGTVYALDGVDGSALWSARFRPNARKNEASENSGPNIFTPFVWSASPEGKAIVMTAYDGGIRGLDGESGRELWRTNLQGRPTGGAAAQLQGDDSGAADIVVATRSPDMLYVMEGQKGQIVSGTKLSAGMIGPPIPFRHGEVRGIAYALEGKQLEIRRRDGSHVKGIKFDVPFTTPPLIFAGPGGTLVVIGTDHGLLFFEGSDLKPLGRISTEEDAPRGRMAAADLEGDGTLDIAFVTRRGRVVVITTAGKISWAAEGATDAYAPTFAHLNNDGVLDVLAASPTAFALGFSGRDGKLLWRADDNAVVKGGDASNESMLRSLTGAISSTGSPLLVGGDSTGSTVRAVGLPAKAAGN